MSADNTDPDSIFDGKRVGQYDLSLRDVTQGRWLENIDLDIDFVDGTIRPTIRDADLVHRVTRGEMSVVARAGEDAGLFEERSYEDYGRSDDPGKYIHQYKVDDVWHDELHYEYRPELSQYGSVVFYVTGPNQA